MPADPVADFLVSVGIDPEALILSIALVALVVFVACLARAAAKGFPR